MQVRAAIPLTSRWGPYMPEELTDERRHQICDEAIKTIPDVVIRLQRARGLLMEGNPVVDNRTKIGGTLKYIEEALRILRPLDVLVDFSTEDEW